MNQALTIAGGAQTIGAVSDYKATGNITYYPGQQINGTVTVLGLGALDFRIDASLPAGVRSWVVNQGVITTKTENGRVLALAAKKTVPSSDAFPYQSPLFPSGIAFPTNPLVAIVNQQRYSLSYRGTRELDGRSVQVVQLQLIPTFASPSKFPASPFRTRDFFIDASTFQVVRVSEFLPKNVPHEFRYSNYQAVQGVLMPFGIEEYIAGQPVWAIQVNQITFNQGLQQSSFEIQ